MSHQAKAVPEGNLILLIVHSLSRLLLSKIEVVSVRP